MRKMNWLLDNKCKGGYKCSILSCLGISKGAIQIIRDTTLADFRLFLLLAANNIDLSQVAVPAKVLAPAVGAAVPAAVAPVASMTQLVDPPKLTLRFPSFVTPERLIQNSIDRYF